MYFVESYYYDNGATEANFITEKDDLTPFMHTKTYDRYVDRFTYLDDAEAFIHATLTEA